MELLLKGHFVAQDVVMTRIVSCTKNRVAYERISDLIK